MSIFLYLICDTGRTQIDVDSRRTEPLEAPRLYTLNYRQMCLFITFFVTLAGHELVWGVQGAEPRKLSGFGQ